MGLTFSDKKQQEAAQFQKFECEACPLAQVRDNKHPNMPATGATKPWIYMLGEAPGRVEDERGVQFVGDSGQLLQHRIPRHLKQYIRYNNVVRTRPPRNRNPEFPEIEACRPSIIRDIEASEPKAIFGFGNVPLHWICGLQGITGWRGRRMPVRVGKHECWYYAMLHPAYILRQRFGDAGPTEIGCEEERVFVFDLGDAFMEVEGGLPPPVIHTPEEIYAHTTLITNTDEDSLDKIERFLQAAAVQPAVGLDYETNCLRPYAKDSKVLTAAVATAKEVLAFPFEHPEASWSENQLDRLNLIWRNFLRTCKAHKVAHNLTFEMEWSGVKFGKDLVRAGVWEDTATQASIIDERKGGSKPGCFSLEFLVQQYFGFNIKALAGVNRAALADTPLEKVLRYNAPDARYALYLYDKQREELTDRGLHKVYNISLRRVPAVVLTQMKGIPVDQATVKTLQTKYESRLNALNDEISSLPIVQKFEKEAEKPFNPFSNPQVFHVFVNMLKRRECHTQDKYTKRPKVSADKTVLAQIDHPLAKALIRIRNARKMKATYIDPLAEGSEILYPDGLLHPVFNTIFAETGRLSAADPNVQNFPKREDETREVRSSIAAPPGHVLLAFDYGQIEARVIAMFTKDKNFCKALWERYDVHGEWAERIAKAYPARIGGSKNLTDKKVMKDFRTDIKNQWTFPLFFGASLSSASKYLSIPDNVLRPEYEKFWEQFSGVKDWQNSLLKFYQQNGYVACLTGRRRRAPLSVNQALNSPVQGTAAEIVMDAMCKLSELNDEEVQPEINVHDDLTFVRVKESRVDVVMEKILEVMLSVSFPWINVPITVEVGIGTNWADVVTLENGTFSSDEWKRPSE